MKRVCERGRSANVQRRERKCWGVALASLVSIILCAACSGAASHEGTADAAGGAGGQQTLPHKELCQFSATCKNGEISGEYGNNCSPVQATCEFGCRASTFSHALANEYGPETGMVFQLAKAALCNERVDGGGGDSAGGASGAPASVDEGAGSAGLGGA